jgi:hypothetical protein
MYLEIDSPSNCEIHPVIRSLHGKHIRTMNILTFCLANPYITGHLVFVLVSTECVMMCLEIDSPSNCEIHPVIRSLHGKHIRNMNILIHCLANPYISGHLVFVLVSTECVMMCLAIDSPSNCEIHPVIRSLHGKHIRTMNILTHCLANPYITGHLVFVLVSTECVMMCLEADAVGCSRLGEQILTMNSGMVDHRL